MDCKIVKMTGIKLIGFPKLFNMENSYVEIPKYWDEIISKYAKNVYEGNMPNNSYEQAVVDNNIGEYGVCIDDYNSNEFKYLIAGKYSGGEIPEGMEIYEIPDCDWAVFDCFGPIPETLQSLNTKIFKEWLPGNSEFKLCKNATIEWYDCSNDTSSPNYHSAIYLPVKHK